MLLGVVSDTHAHVAKTREALRMLDALGAKTVIHCGDIGSLEIPKLFVGFAAHFVAGNVDHDAKSLAKEIASLGHTWHGRFGELTLENRRIAFLHGDDQERLDETLDRETFDLVCHGHTHQAEIRRVNEKTTLLNPGALYRASRFTCAVVDLADLAVHLIPVE